MRRLPLLIALVCLLAQPALCGDWCTDTKSAKVCSLKNQLDTTAQQRDQAEQQKSAERQALERALQAAEKAWSHHRKRENQAAATQAEARFNAAKVRLDYYDRVSLQQAAEYIEAEDSYKAQAGEVRYPSTYNFWKSRLNYQNESGQVKEGDLDSNVDAARKTLNAPAKGAGGLFEKARALGKIGDTVMMDNLKWQQNQQPPNPAMKSSLDLAGPVSSHGAGDFGAKADGRGMGSLDPLKSRIMLSPKRDDVLPTSPRKSKAVQRAQELADRGDYKTALSVINKSLASEKGSAELFTLKAKMLNKLRRFAEAEEAAQQALFLDPDDPDALKALIWAQLHQKKYAEALKNSNRLVLLAPEDPESYLLRAFAHEGLGQRSKMIADLEKAAALDPKYKGHLQLAKSGARLFNPDDSDSESLLEAIAVAPAANKAKPFMVIGLVLLTLGAGTLLWLKRKSLQPQRAGPKVGTSSAVPAPAESASKPAPLIALKPNDVLGKKYKLMKLEYDTPTCRIWSAQDESLGRAVLVKQIPYPPGPAAQEAKAALLQEAQVLALLHHPNIVDLYEVMDLPAGFCWVFESTPGRSVRRMLEKKKYLPWATAKAVLIHAAQGLAFAHGKNVLHKNLRPDNMIVTLQGVLKVGEFAPLAPPQAMQPPYAAPEGAHGMATPASDVYSLGVCLYELLTGALPSEPYVPICQWVADLDPRIDGMLRAALTPDPGRRMQSAAEFRGYLLNL